MPVFAGLQDTLGVTADERPKSFRSGIWRMKPNGTAPLFAMTSGNKDERIVDDPEFSWFFQLHAPVKVTLNSALIGATTLTCVSGALALRPGDLLLIEKADAAAYDNEIVRVVSITNDTTFVVIRGAAGSTAAAISANQVALRMSKAIPEGTPAAAPGGYTPSKGFNYIQLFSHSYEYTDVAGKTNMRSQSTEEQGRENTAYEHAEAIEFSMFFGKRSETVDATTGRPFRTMGGLRQFITSNVTIFGGAGPAANLDNLIAAIDPVFKFRSPKAGNERIAYCGRKAMNSIEKILRATNSIHLNYNGPVNFMGQTFKEFQIGGGTVRTMIHPLLQNSPTYDASIFIVDPSVVNYCYLRGFDTKVRKDIQAPSAHTKQNEFYTGCSMEMIVEVTSAYLGNFIA